MEDIRSEIDQLDRAIVELIGKRYRYVVAAARFKTSEAAVRAPERFKAMLSKRREWAAEEGLDPDAIEKLFADLVTHFIEQEINHWKAGDRLPDARSPRE